MSWTNQRFTGVVATFKKKVLPSRAGGLVDEVKELVDGFVLVREPLLQGLDPVVFALQHRVASGVLALADVDDVVSLERPKT